MHTTPKKILWIILCFYSLISQANSFNSSLLQSQAEKDITQLYHNFPREKNMDINSKIAWFSEQFVGIPYYLFSLGEGPNAAFDQYPLYRTDVFDCETLVDTVLALSIANNTQNFISWINKIRYREAKPTYVSRNHFAELDWNQNNQRLGLIQDITKNLGKKDTAFAKTIIDKSGWYLKKPLSIIRLQNPVEEKVQKRHSTLVAKNKQFKPISVITPYLPFTLLFNENNQPNLALFKQIPQASIIEIIRPDWNLKKIIGTNLNVSHMGFAIWKDGVLYFRQASSQLGKVVDVPLVDYLIEARKSPTIKGINVQGIVS